MRTTIYIYIYIYIDNLHICVYYGFHSRYYMNRMSILGSHCPLEYPPGITPSGKTTHALSQPRSMLIPRNSWKALSSSPSLSLFRLYPIISYLCLFDCECVYLRQGISDIGYFQSNQMCGEIRWSVSYQKLFQLVSQFFSFICKKIFSYFLSFI